VDVEVTMHSSDFGARHYEAVSEQLGLTTTRLPSDTTFRRILQKLDFQALAKQFGQWASHNIDIQPQEWIAIDGKWLCKINYIVISKFSQHFFHIIN
jgi:hypothetical protein